jgi:thymidine phosphorylase
LREPPIAPYTRPILSPHGGLVAAVDNRKLARLAKLAGAPDAKAAGIALHVRLGDSVLANEPLCTLHAETPGELDYALAFAAENPNIIGVSAP